MINTRLIPVLLIKEQSLVKTINFNKPQYIGDPLNTALMFNDLKADELILLNIDTTYQKKTINYDLLKIISKKCFMPLSYGGGINSIEKAKKVIKCGYEKIIINYQSIKDKNFITELAKNIGSQAIIVSVDYKIISNNLRTVFTLSGTKNTKLDPLNWALKIEELGAGEIMLTSIDHEGQMKGYDLEYINKVSKKLKIPLIANGGASSKFDIQKIVNLNSVSAAAFSSVAIYQNRTRNVLINYPKLILN